MISAERAMRWFLPVVGAACGAVLTGLYCMFSGPAPALIYGDAGIAGEYSALVDLKPASRRTVRLDIYEDFGCPACQRLDTEGLQPLLKAYGDRLDVHKHYVASPAGNTSAKILYDIASDRGMGAPVAAALMRAGLSRGENNPDLLAVVHIARQHGLESSFVQARADGSGMARIEKEWAVVSRKIGFFPFVVIEGVIVANGDTTNLRMIIDSLLIPPHASAG